MGKALHSYIIVLGALVLSACSADYNISSNTPMVPPVVDITVSPSPQNVLQINKPALAVKAMECVACHAKIDANVITDFGLGTPNFFKGAYGDVDEQFRLGWQGFPTQVSGQIIVPSSVIDSKTLEAAQLRYQAGTNAGLDIAATDAIPNTLKQILNTNWKSYQDFFDKTTPVVSYPSIGSIAQGGVSERATVVIRTPAANEILNLFSDKGANYPEVQSLIGSDVSGFSLAAADANMSAPGAQFVRNTGTVTCHGDVAINGTLYLKELNLVTDANGCRLYVTESVFIEGPITSNQPSNEANLQIASARSIMIGLGLRRMGVSSASYASVKNGSLRFVGDQDSGLSWNQWPHLATAYEQDYEPGTDSATRKAYFDAIATDARKIGAELKDSTDIAKYPSPLPAGYALVTRTNGDMSSRLAVNYAGLLLNAPHIHSGYLGKFSGVVIANLINFVISNFNFAYDSIFEQGPGVLPAISPVLQISGN